MKTVIKSICVFLILFFTACSNTSPKNEQQEIIIEETTEQKEEPIIQPKKNLKYDAPFHIDDIQEIVPPDSVTINLSFLNRYLEKGHYRNITDEEYEKLQIGQIMFSPQNGDSLFILNTFKFENKDYYSRLFSNQQDGVRMIWMVNYRLTDHTYIDSRRIYHLLKERYRNELYSIYSSANECFTFYNSYYDSVTDVFLSTEGNFEEFDFIDIPYRNDTIVYVSMEGLLGKFPEKEKWTCLLLDRENNLSVEIKETQNVENGWLDYGVTLLDGDVRFDYDIAFKGVYSPDHFKLLEAEKKEKDRYRPLVEDMISVLPEDEYVTFSISGLYHFNYYNIIQCWVGEAAANENDFDVYPRFLVGKHHKGEPFVLADRCPSKFYFFQMGEDFFLYIDYGSCGEGAYSESSLYKLDRKGIELIYKEGRHYD